MLIPTLLGVTIAIVADNAPAKASGIALAIASRIFAGG